MADETMWYRFEDRRVAVGGVDLDGEYRYSGSYADVRLIELYVIKHTPKGVWLSQWKPVEGEKPNPGIDRFVLRDARKRYACPTLEEAKASFLARKNKQMRILANRLNSVREAIAAFERQHGDRLAG